MSGQLGSCPAKIRHSTRWKSNERLDETKRCGLRSSRHPPSRSLVAIRTRAAAAGRLFSFLQTLRGLHGCGTYVQWLTCGDTSAEATPALPHSGRLQATVSRLLASRQLRAARYGSQHPWRGEWAPTTLMRRAARCAHARPANLKLPTRFALIPTPSCSRFWREKRSNTYYIWLRRAR